MQSMEPHMQRTPNAAETQNTLPKQQAVPPVGPQVIDPSMFKFVSGGLPRDGGWAIVAAEPATAAASST
jgi:hypothetical protein